MRSAKDIAHIIGRYRFLLTAFAVMMLMPLPCLALQVTAGDQAPADFNISGGVHTEVIIGQIKLVSNEIFPSGVTIESITMQETGAANGSADISAVKLILDNDNSGTNTAGDIELSITGAYQFTSDGASLTMNLSTGASGRFSIVGGTYKQVLIAVKTTATFLPTDSDKLRVQVNGVGAKVLTSGADASVAALTLNSAIGTAVGSLLTSGNATLPAAGAVTCETNLTNLPVLQLNFASGMETVNIDSITITEAGTINGITGLGTISLYLDADGDAQVTGGETLLATGNFGGDNGTVVLNPAAMIAVAPGTPVNVLVTVNTINGGFNAGNTIILRLANPSTDVIAVGASSAASIADPSTTAIVSKTKTGRGSGSAANGLSTPANGVHPAGAQAAVIVHQVLVNATAAENININSILVHEIGSANATSDIVRVFCAIDTDNNGSLNGAEGERPTAANVTFTTDNGTANITFVTPIPVTAGGSVNLLIGYQTAASFAGGATLASRIDDVGTGISATGVSSSQSVPLTGAPAMLTSNTIKGTGTLSAVKGTSSPSGGIRAGANTNAPILQVKLTAGAGENVNVTSITVREQGTITETSDTTSVSVAVDTDGDGVLDAGETIIGTSTFASNESTIALAPAVSVPMGGSANILVVASTNAGFAFGETIQFDVWNPSIDLTAAGALSTETIQSTDPTIAGTNLKASGSFSVTKHASSPNEPNGVTVEGAGSKYPILLLTFTASADENVVIDRITIAESGSCDGATDLSNIGLILDANSNGLLDAGENVISGTGVATFSGANGTITLDPPGAADADMTVTKSTGKSYFVTCNTNASFTGGETIVFSVVNPSTDIFAAGVDSGVSLKPGETTAVTSGTLQAKGTLKIAAGAVPPTGGLDYGVRTGIAFSQFRLTAGNEAVNVTSMTFTENGSADGSADMANVGLVIDANANGIIDGAETVLAGTGTAAFSADGGTITLTPTTPVTVPLAGNVTLLLVCNTLAGFGVNETLSAVVAAPLTHISATGASSARAITDSSGLTNVGAGSIRGQGTVSMKIGPNTPAAGAIPFQANTDVSLLQIQIGAHGENMAISSITVTEDGTAPGNTAITAVGLAVDTGGDGLFGVGDTKLTISGATVFPSDNGSVQLTIDGSTPLNVSAGTTVEVLVLLNTDAAAFSVNTTLKVRIANPSTDYAATGGTTAFALTDRSTTAVVGNELRAAGKATLTVGAIPAAGGTTAGARNNIAVAQFTIDPLGENVNLTGITITETGSANGSDDITSVGLVQDTNANGIMDVTESEMVLNGGNVTFAADNGTVTLTLSAPVQISIGAAKSFLVTFDTDNSFLVSENDSLRAAVANPHDHLMLTGLTSGQNVHDPSTVAVTGNELVASGTISLSAGPQSPADSTIIQGVHTGVVLQQIQFTAAMEAVNITSIMITESGTCDGSTDIMNVGLVIDLDNSGTVNGTEAVQAGTGVATFAVDDGTVTVTPTTPIAVTTAAPVRLLIVADTTATLIGGETIKIGINNPSTDYAATGLPQPAGSGQPIRDSSITAITSATATTIGTIAASLGANTPPAGGVGAGVNANVPILQIAFAAGTENVSISSITLRETGSANGLTDISAVGLVIDVNNDGVVSGGESMVAGTGSATFPSDNGSLTITPTNPMIIPAGTTVNVLVIFNTTSTFAIGEVLRCELGNPSSDYVAKGVVSNKTIGDSSTTAIVANSQSGAGRIAASIGAASPGTGNIPAGAFNQRVFLQLAFTAGAEESVNISSITLTEAGTANGTTDIRNIGLILDNGTGGGIANDGVVNGAEILISNTGTQTFGADDGTVTLNPSTPVNVPAGTTVNVLVVADTLATFGAGETIRFTMVNPRASFSAVGLTSSQVLRDPSTANLEGGILKGTGSVTVSTGPANPVAGNIRAGAAVTDQVAMQVKFQADSVEPLRLVSVTMTEQGTLDGLNEITRVDLVIDADNDGVKDAGEPVLARGGSATFNQNDGTLVLQPNTPIDIAAGNAVNILVICNLSSSITAGKTLIMSIADPRTGVVAQGVNSTETIRPSLGTAVTSSTFTYTGSVSSAAGAASPVSGGIPAGANTNVVVQQLRFSAGAGEDVRITSITISEGGTAHGTSDITSVSLVDDLNGNGKIDSGETEMAGTGSQTFVSDNGTVVLAPSTPITVQANLSKNILVVADTSSTFSAGASPADALIFKLNNPSTDYVALGSVSGKVLADPSSASITSGTLTAIGAIAMVKGTSSPAAGGINYQVNANLPVLQLKFTAGSVEAVNIESVTVTEDGTAIGNVDITGVGMFLDNGDGNGIAGNGIQDGTEQMVVNPLAQNFPGDNGPVTLTPAAPVAIPAGGSINLVVVINTALSLDVNRTVILKVANPSVDYVARGANSSTRVLDPNNTAVASSTLTTRGILTAVLGPVPATGAIQAGSHNDLVVMQLQLSAAGENINLSSVTVAETGTADGMTHMTNIGLVSDNGAGGGGIGNGVIDGSEAILAGTGVATFSADNGTITLTPTSPVTVSAGNTLSLLVTVDTPIAFPAGKSIIFSMDNPSTRVIANGVTSGQSLKIASTAALTANTITSQGTAAVAAGAAMPAARAISATAVSVRVPLLQFTLAATGETVEFTSLILTETGTANGSTHMANVGLVLDADGSGSITNAEAMIAGTGTATFGADNGTLTLTPTTSVKVASGSTATFLVVADSVVPGFTVGQTLSLSIADPPNQVVCTGSISAGTIKPAGAAVVGNAVTGTGTVAMALGASTPGTVAGPNFIVDGAQAGVNVFQVAVTATGEDMNIASIAFTEAGTVDATTLTNLSIIPDDGTGGGVAGDGIINGAEAALALTAPASFSGDNGKATLTFAAPYTVSAGTTMNLIFTVDTNATFTGGKNLKFTVAAPATDYAVQGVTSAQAVKDSGTTAISGNTLTAKGTIALALGAANPGAANIPGGARQTIPVMQLAFTAGTENVELVSLTLTESGALDASSDLSRIDVVVDNGTGGGTADDGIVNGGEARVALTSGGTFAGDNGSSVLLFASPIVVNAGATLNLIVVADTNASFRVADGDTIMFTVANPSTSYVSRGALSQAPLTDASAVAINSSVLTAIGNLTAAAGAAMPAASNVPTAVVTTGKVLGQFALTAGGEAVVLDTLKFTRTGTCQDADVTALFLIADNGAGGGSANDGIVNGGEAAFPVGGSGVFAAGSCTFNLTGDAAGVRTVAIDGTINLLVVANIAATFVAGESLGVSMVNPSTDITSTGDTSAAAVAPISTTAIASSFVTSAGTLTVAAGPNPPAGGNTREGVGTNLPVMQLRFTAAGENLSITSLTITEIGSANGATAVSEVSLALDNGTGGGTADDGILNGGETEIAASKGATFAADNGSITFNLTASPIVVTAGSQVSVLVLMDSTATFAGGTSLRCEVTNPSTAVSATGQTSAATVKDIANTTAIQSSTFLGVGSLTLAQGANQAANGPLKSGINTGVAMTQFTVTAGSGEAVKLVSVRLTESGTANGATDVSSVYLAVDTNGNGVLDGAEAALAGTGGSTFGADNGTILLTPTTPYVVAAGSTVTLLGLCDTTTSFGIAETLTGSIATPSGNVTGQGNSSLQTAYINGVAVTGTTWTGAGTISAVYGGFPAPGAVEAKGLNQRITLFSLNMTAAGETVNISSMTFSESGTVDAAVDLANVGLVLDADGDGIADAGETTLAGTGLATFNGANGSITLTPTVPISVTSLAVSRILVVADTNVGFGSGKTIRVVMTNPSTDYAAAGAVTSLALKDASTTAISGNEIRAVVPCDAAVAEISPVMVDSDGRTINSFSLGIRPTITATNSGVNKITVAVPADFTAVSLGQVRLNGTSLNAGADYISALAGNTVNITLTSKLTSAQSGQEILLVIMATSPDQSKVGQKTFAVTLDDSVKPSPVTAIAGDSGTTIATSTLTVVAGGIDHFDVVPASLTPVSGAKVTLTVTARDQNSNVVAFYDGKLKVTVAGATAATRLRYTGISLTDNLDGTADITNTGSEWNAGVLTFTAFYDLSGESLVFTVTEKDTGLSRKGSSQAVIWQSDKATATITATGSSVTTVELTNGSKVVIEPGSVPEAVNLTFTQNYTVTDMDDRGIPVPDPEDLNPSVVSVRTDASGTSNLISYDIKPHGTILSKPFELFTPVPAHVTPAEYAKLRYYYWDGYEWQGSGGTTVTQNGKVFLKSTVQHFALFRMTMVDNLPLVSSGKVIQSIKFVNNPFSPNGDGINDNLVVKVTFGRQATVSLKIYDSAGDLVHTIIKNQDVSPGEMSWEWRGSTRWGDSVEPGAYILRIEAATATGGGNESAMIGVVY
ncbi:MAG: hypothetical protein CVV64_11170 [Candidatus Wallbacteria bacterium HGW-Wallbacteria-1]|jgi:hypothetical protein|uniref:Uncharacterized protein n=1 Tax=Candidatus Wallbacteria bacterium HGW-Wallbacteria-1 TaxID=2013854 RepID=A0A2N1PP66_9BACT|nr:MAG: hypothetical protein CVV64_11170 [Candidatus Wallbacteria bacterium HGW-Wallbacteria-1]